MDVWTDVEGNKLTPKQFGERFKEGLQKVTPFQQTKITLIGTILVMIGVCIGLYATFGTWWLFIILCGSFFITGVSLFGIIQKYTVLKKMEENFGELNLEENIENVKSN